jgi:adenine/guanine phosphoribosyltransferase-like PRPP-binding protein
MAGKLGTRLRREIGIVEGHADVWRLFDDPELLRTVAAALVDPFRGEAAKVAGIESRGFIIGSARLGVAARRATARRATARRAMS